MKTQRAAASLGAGDEQRPAKRRKIKEQSPSVDDLNDDCLLNIVTYLPVEDLNSIAMVNHGFRKARSHESLDQTRSGTIVLLDSSTGTTLLDAIQQGDWVTVFSGNRTHLKIVGIEKLQGRREERLEGILPAVTSLGVRSSSPTAPSFNYDFNCVHLFSMFSNVTELNLSGMNTTQSSTLLMYGFARLLPQVTKLTWNGYHDGYNHICGKSFENFKRLKELQLDNCKFTCVATSREELVNMYGDPEADSWLLRKCNRDSLRSVSIKNATWHRYTDRQSEPKVFPQELLIKFVRKFPSLRWFRSDLTAANVAMLKEERPEITFVSE